MDTGDDIIEVRLVVFPSEVATDIWISSAADKALRGFARDNEGKLFTK